MAFKKEICDLLKKNGNKITHHICHIDRVAMCMVSFQILISWYFQRLVNVLLTAINFKGLIGKVTEINACELAH